VFTLALMDQHTFTHNGWYGRLINASYTELNGERVNLIHGCPPYNIGSKCPLDKGGRLRGGFDNKSYTGITDYKDDYPEDVYEQMQLDFLDWCYDHLLVDGVVVYNHKHRRKNKEILQPERWLLRQKKLRIVDMVTWDKGSTVNHDKTQVWNHTELFYVMVKAEAKRWYMDTDRDDLSDEHGDSRKTPWYFAPQKSWHQAAMPLKLAMRIVRKWCPPGGKVAEPYAGSATGMLAALLLGRNSIGAENNSQFFMTCCNEMTLFLQRAKAQMQTSLPK